MPRNYSISAYVAQQRKRRTVKTRDRYNISNEEEAALHGDVMHNSGSRQWGMSARLADAYIDRHKNGNEAMKRVVIDQIDDMNYHRFAKMLDKGDYKGALRMSKEMHKEQGTKPSAQYSAQYALING